MTGADVARLAKAMGVTPADFVAGYTQECGGRMVLQDRPGSTDCILMDGDRCSVWGAHPKQCDEEPSGYDPRCPGFKVNTGEAHMDYKEAVERVNRRFSALREWDQAVTDQFYRNLAAGDSGARIASKALEGGVDPYKDTNMVRVASIDDLFAFHRAGENHLIHKSTRDLWSIESDDNGARITRLFDNDGEPIKG